MWKPGDLSGLFACFSFEYISSPLRGSRTICADGRTDGRAGACAPASNVIGAASRLKDAAVTGASDGPRVVRATGCAAYALCRLRVVPPTRCATRALCGPRVVLPTRCATRALCGPRVRGTTFCAQHHRKSPDSGLRLLCGNERSCEAAIVEYRVRNTQACVHRHARIPTGIIVVPWPQKAAKQRL